MNPNVERCTSCSEDTRVCWKLQKWFLSTGGATTTGPDATYPQRLKTRGGGVRPGVGGQAGGRGGVGWGEGGGVRVRVTELVEPVLVL